MTAGTSSWRSSPTSSERLTVARILGAKGLAGGVRIEVLTDWPERLIEGAQLFVEGEHRARRVRRTELGGRVPILHLDGIDTREAAAELTGRYLEADAAGLPHGTYYWHELEGLDVLDEQGMQIGTVVEVFRAGGGEVYRVVGPAGERLVPALQRVVRKIDLDTRSMVIRLDDEEDVG